MTKKELIQSLAEAGGISFKQAEAVYAELMRLTTVTLIKGERLRLPDLGTFSVTEVAARKGINPATGQSIKIKATKRVKFSVSAPVKALVAEGKIPKEMKQSVKLSQPTAKK